MQHEWRTCVVRLTRDELCMWNCQISFTFYRQAKEMSAKTFSRIRYDELPNKIWSRIMVYFGPTRSYITNGGFRDLKVNIIIPHVGVILTKFRFVKTWYHELFWTKICQTNISNDEDLTELDLFLIIFRLGMFFFLLRALLLIIIILPFNAVYRSYYTRDFLIF